MLSFLALACAVAARILAERHVYGAPAAPAQQDVVFHGPPGTRICWVPSESAVADLGACYEIGADRERRISSWPGHAFDVLRPAADDGAAPPPRVVVRAGVVSYDTTAPPAPLTAADTLDALARRWSVALVTPAWCRRLVRGPRERWLDVLTLALALEHAAAAAAFFFRARRERKRERKPAAAAARPRPGAAAPPPATTHHAWLAFAVVTMLVDHAARLGLARECRRALSASARAGWQLGRLHRMSEHWWLSALTLPAQLFGAPIFYWLVGANLTTDADHSWWSLRASRAKSGGGGAGGARVARRAADTRLLLAYHGLHTVVAQPLPGGIEPHTLVTLAALRRALACGLIGGGLWPAAALALGDAFLGQEGLGLGYGARSFLFAGAARAAATAPRSARAAAWLAAAGLLHAHQVTLSVLRPLAAPFTPRLRAALVTGLLLAFALETRGLSRFERRELRPSTHTAALTAALARTTARRSLTVYVAHVSLAVLASRAPRIGCDARGALVGGAIAPGCRPLSGASVVRLLGVPVLLVAGALLERAAL